MLVHIHWLLDVLVAEEVDLDDTAVGAREKCQPGVLVLLDGDGSLLNLDRSRHGQKTVLFVDIEKYCTAKCDQAVVVRCRELSPLLGCSAAL